MQEREKMEYILSSSHFTQVKVMEPETMWKEKDASRIDTVVCCWFSLDPSRAMMSKLTWLDYDISRCIHKIYKNVATLYI